MTEYVVGIDIGGTNIRTGLVDKNGILSYFQQDSSQNLLGENPIFHLASHINSYLKSCCSEKNVVAVSIGFPSIVSKDKTTLHSTPNLPGFDNLIIKIPLENEIGIPIFIEKDTNFLLQNDIKELNLDSNSIILGFYIGTGFGNSIYLKGEYFSGKNGAAGELGHIPLYDIFDVCSCDNIGCSETRCSGRYLENLRMLHFPDTPISQIFIRHKHSPVLQGFVKNLALPIATEINILDPEIAIIGGGVVGMDDFPKNTLLESIWQKVRKPYPAKNLSICFGTSTNKAGVIGGGIYAHNLLSSNTTSNLKK